MTSNVDYGPKPGGPTHPTPTGPPRPTPPPADIALAALVADVERQLAAPLAVLSAAVADGLADDATTRRLNAAANHINCALNRLARTQSPARRDLEAALGASAVATTGGPVNVPGESLSPGCGNGRVGGAPDAATFSLLTFMPRPGKPKPGGDPRPRPTPPPPPGLSWLPTLMLPSLLLLAAIDYTAWAAWWV